MVNIHRDNCNRQMIAIGLAILAIIVCMFIGLINKACGDDCTSSASNIIDTSGFIEPEVKNNVDLAEWAQIAYREKWGYVWGTYGCILDDQRFEQKIEQYPDSVGDYSGFITENWLGGRTADCIGLIKGYSWYDVNNECFGYCINDMPDIGADRMFENAAEKGEIDTIPEIVGLAVWAEGHIGVYIGDGWVIEAMSTLDGVKKTRLTDRPWTHWLKIPYIEYYEDDIY